ncbi:MAG: efflux RND transporter periplasmic adaptor subunit [Planctomycetes bacterium]|nr:efflux RND transporter periplasmic adaptor subunit [Planctomycetota bacterium]
MKRTPAVLLSLAVGIAATITWKMLQPKPPVQVVTAKAERLPKLRSIVSATGQIQAKEFVDIQAEVAGVITEVLVKEGDHVDKGAVLLKLEDLQLRAEVDAARAQVGAAEADAKNAEVGVATAEANVAAERTNVAGVKVECAQAKVSSDRAEASFRRKEELFQSKLIGNEEYEVATAETRLAQQRLEFAKARFDQAEANLRVVETRVDAAKAVRDAALRRVESAQAALARAVDMLDKTVLRAPLSGLITKLEVEKGERAVPGFQSNPIATLMTIADMSVIEAEIQVAEADIIEVRLGAEAEVEVDAMRDRKLQGVVTEIGQSPIQSSASGSGQNQEGKEFKVVVRLTAPPPELRTGLTATAEIVTATRTNVLVVPFTAQVEPDVELDNDGNYVAPAEPKEGEAEVELTAAQRQQRKPKKGVYLRQDGKARFRPVTFGVIGETQDIEVLDGLVEGDEVVIGPAATLRTLKEWTKVDLDEKRSRKGK